jgi:hypothetical protein
MQPVSHPSYQPTANPLIHGVTKTSRPTPTAKPTLSVAARWQNRLSDLSSEYGYLITDSSVVYADAVVNGTSIYTYSKRCADWNSFTAQLALNTLAKTFSSITVVYSTKIIGQSDSSSFISCSQPTSLLAIEGLGEGSVDAAKAVVCTGSDIGDENSTWLVGSCSATSALCVNCLTAVGNNLATLFAPCAAAASSETCSPGFTSVSASSEAGDPQSFARLLIATFTEDSAPTIITLNVTAFMTSTQIVAVLSGPGSVYCTVSSRRPSSVQEITLANNVGSTLSDFYHVNISISSLSPATTYSVYCVTQSLIGTQSSLLESIAGKVSVTTLCCRTILVTMLQKSVFVNNAAASVIQLLLSSSPSKPFSISVWGTLAGVKYPMYFPTNMSVSTVTSNSLSLAYIGVSVPGLYNVTVQVRGAGAAQYTVMFAGSPLMRVLSATSTVAPPQLSSAQFADDGASLILTFDMATNRGSSTSSNVFQCSTLFSFAGVGQSRCQWSVDSTTVTVVPSASSPSSIGDVIQLLANRVRAYCPGSRTSSECSQWPMSAGKNLTLSGPSFPIKPAVVLTLPSSVGSCDSLRLDIGGSTGGGGRPWSYVNITASSVATNISSLTQYLNAQYKSGSVMVPEGMLQKGFVYRFSVVVCNFLGVCGHGSGSVTVLNIVVPFVSILGGPTLSTTSNSTLQLSSLAYVASCDGSRPTLNLLYSWSVNLLSNGTASALTWGSSSKDPSRFVLPPYQLKPQSTYRVQLTVTYMTSLKSSTSSMTVVVISSDLIIVIAGGCDQSVRLKSSFTIDASGSYDSGQLTAVTGVSYSWQCIQTSPTYSYSCPLSLSTAGSNVLAGSVPLTAASTTSVLSLTMFDAARSASAQVSLVVLPSSSPIVTIVAAPAGRLTVNSRVVLQGSVSTANTCESLWTVDDANVNLTAVSVVPPRRILTGTGAMTLSPVYISLVPNSLPAGASLKFTLQCTGAGVGSYASVMVVTNSPPTPGFCQISPASGQALSTVFTFTASAWVDVDLPLSYEFGFMSPATNAILLVQTKSQSAVGQSLLPAGSSPDGSNSSLSGEFRIFDSLGSESVVSAVVSVVARKLNASLVSALASTLLQQSSGSVDGLKQVISVVASSVNAVNCSMAPNCTALNRFSCFSTPHTCSGCLTSAYVGEDGDSNGACVLASEAVALLSRSYGFCVADADCGAWSTCSQEINTCQARSKSCPGNCSFAGQCIFVSDDTGELLTSCPVASTSCSAECICGEGAFGSDCSQDAEEFSARQSTTSGLLEGLSEVHSLETLDDKSAVYWTNALASLTATSALLTDASISTAQNISAAIFAGVISGQIALGESTMDTIGGVLNNVMVSSVFSNSRRRRRLGTASFLSAEALIDYLSQSVTSQMVSGQTQQTFIQPNYRLTASILSSPNVSFSMPRSTLESLSSGSDVAAAKLTGASTGSSVALASVPTYLTQLPAGLNTTANSFRLTAGSASSGCVGAPSITFTFVHHETEQFGVNASNVTFISKCVNGQASPSSVSCPQGISVVVACHDARKHTVITVCPKLRRSPSCGLFFDGYASQDNSSCKVVNYTSTTTTCQCNMCHTGVARGRRLSTGDTGNVNVVALSTSSFTELASVMASASTFDSLAAVKASLLIIVTFVVMWLGTMVAVTVTGYSTGKVAGRGKDAKTVKIAPASASREDERAVGLQSVEAAVKEYVSELFSMTYSDNTYMVRLFQELYQRHKYASVFGIGRGSKQCMEAYALLTNRTASFFLLAMFYDIQFPSDDGSCALLTQSQCSVPRSRFNSDQAKCVWVIDLNACAWQPPAFDVYSTVVVSVVVLLVSVPVYLVLSLVFNKLLLAPTVAEVQRGQLSMKTRRASAVSIMSAARGRGSAADQVSKRSVGMFSSVREMDASVKEATVKAHRLMKKMISRSGSQINFSKDEAYFRSFDHFIKDLKLQHVAGHYRRRVTSSGGNNAVWHTLLDEDEAEACTDEDRPVRAAAVAELAKVIDEADDWVAKLEPQPPVDIGVQILELFVRDCLGRGSREATIFSHKVHPFRAKVVVTWAIKCFTCSCLLILNLYFIFSCMLYGRDKGLKWQQGWLYTCLVNLFVDIFINQVTVSAVVHYLIPNLIAEKARFIQASIARSIHDLCVVNRRLEETEIGDTSRGLEVMGALDLTMTTVTPTSYYFVSAHVARKFPDLLESRIVLNCNAVQLSKEQMLVFQAASYDRIAALMAARRNGFYHESEWGELGRGLGVWITSLLMFFGSQSFGVQEVLISMFNPVLVMAMAFIGISVLNKSFFGIPVGAVMMLAFVALVAAVASYVMHLQRQHEEEEDIELELGSDAHTSQKSHWQSSQKHSSLNLSSKDQSQDGAQHDHLDEMGSHPNFPHTFGTVDHDGAHRRYGLGYPDGDERVLTVREEDDFDDEDEDKHHGQHIDSSAAYYDFDGYSDEDVVGSTFKGHPEDLAALIQQEDLLDDNGYDDFDFDGTDDLSEPDVPDDNKDDDGDSFDWDT